MPPTRNGVTQKFANLYQISFEDVDLIKNFDQEKSKVNREDFMERYKLQQKKITELDGYITEFTEEAILFDKSQSMMIELMFHGRNGKILGISQLFLTLTN